MGDMIPASSRIPGIFCLALLAGCTTTSVDPTELQVVRDVDAVQAIDIDRICVEVNTSVKTDFTDALFAAIKELGFATQSRQSAFGNECRHWLSYRATWAGRVEYLASADIKVYEERKQLGRIHYDASKAGNRPDRYGSAISKLQPLLKSLFVHVER